MNPAIVSTILTVLILFIAARSLRRRRRPGIALLDCGVNCAMFFIANGGGIAWTSQISVVLWWLTVMLCASGTACSIFTYLLTLRSD